nr:hypothetical protein [Tanacetum cinerariifolium]
MKNSRYLWLQDSLEGLGKVSTCFVFFLTEIISILCFESCYVCGDGMISGDIIEEDGFSCEEGGGSECGHFLIDNSIVILHLEYNLNSWNFVKQACEISSHLRNLGSFALVTSQMKKYAIIYRRKPFNASVKLCKKH